MEQVPKSVEPTLSEYLFRQLNRLELLLLNNKMQLLTAMPSKPELGKIYYFKNTILPDITAEGVWVYKSTGWSYLG